MVNRKCASCYTPLQTVLCCGRCRKRSYCSRECQALDWKQHKLWCGRVGELDIDVEIKAVEGCGLGLFALHDFDVGDKIFVERAAITVPNCSAEKKYQIISENLLHMPLSLQEAVNSLYPVSISDDMDQKMNSRYPGLIKFKYNSFKLGDDDESDSGLFVTLSRINHSCLPNCSRTYFEDQELMVIIANAPITRGDQLTISYSFVGLGVNFAANQSHIRNSWKFVCQCSACETPAIGEKLSQLDKLDTKLLRLGSTGHGSEAYAVGEMILAICDELREFCGIHCLRQRERTYYDMFQMAVMRKRTLSKARACLKSSLDNVILLYGGSIPEARELIEKRELVAHPERHRNYLLLER